MKKAKVLSIFLLLAVLSQGQSFSELRQVKLRDAETCRQYNHKALECARYILDTPHQSADSARTGAMQFLITWMSATPDYQFQLDDQVGRLNPQRESLLGEFMAGMAIYCLENPGSEPEADSISRAAWHRLAQYCADPSHGVRLTKAIRRLISNDAEGKLENYTKK